MKKRFGEPELSQKMSNWYPDLLPIMREEDYHTHYLGETEKGILFFGYETFVFPKGFSSENWENERLEYALVYLFDKNGNHIETKYKLAGKTSDISPNQTNKMLSDLISELGNFIYKDIKVKPFKTTIDGIEFGLVPNEEIQMIELQPSSTIAFGEPWDGEYDT
ncbi:hypothetical protein [Carboxylicivirga marina]|uniref:Uncharacterized protein n=1 Tax=Carboxylicivirga marina TaxID=2800988 RepID=A0ABS1HQS9_9BACT|nr:hypothetical protein [Carboxylicivirga marina]MBK3520029.1 hypothetical protein [Carboxylicivirga marina]